MMLLNEGNGVGAKDLAVDFPILRVICIGRKNPPLCHVDCIGCFIACFDVQLLRVILFDFKPVAQRQEMVNWSLVPLPWSRIS